MHATLAVLSFYLLSLNNGERYNLINVECTNEAASRSESRFKPHLQFLPRSAYGSLNSFVCVYIFELPLSRDSHAIHLSASTQTDSRAPENGHIKRFNYTHCQIIQAEITMGAPTIISAKQCHWRTEFCQLDSFARISTTLPRKNGNFISKNMVAYLIDLRYFS